MKHSRHLVEIMLFVLLCLFTITSCEFFPEDPNKPPKAAYLDYMPEETNIGANTFGCYVNGKLEAVRGLFQKEGIAPHLGSYVNGFWEKYKNDTTLKLHIISKQATFYIHLHKCPHLGDNNCSFYLSLQSVSQGSGSIDTTSIDILKFDTISHIISGRFNDITIPMQFPESIVHLTDGQFDIKYGQNF